MIEQVANNKFNTEVLNPNPPAKVKEKLDYFRSFFGKVHNLPEKQFEALKAETSRFFNLKPVHLAANYPERLVRISNNNRILKTQEKTLSYLTEIDQLLAPPVANCQYGRCNLAGQQVLYCAMDEASAYWEVKPEHGDVITIAHFKLKENIKINCSVITNKESTRDLSHQLLEIYYLLDDFFIDAYSLPVNRDQPRDYLFSALLSSEQLFYPVVSPRNIEAIIFPSVQRGIFGNNFAIRNDLIFEKYDLIAVETRFILDKIGQVDPKSFELTTDDLMGSMASYTFDFENRKILYDEQADMIFNLFRNMQTGGQKQIRYDNPQNIKRIPFNLSKRRADQVVDEKQVDRSGDFTIGIIPLKEPLPRG